MADARTVFRDPFHLLAFGFGSGLAPKAPGTFGTLAALPLAVLAWLPPFVIAAAFGVLLAVLAVWICGVSARRLGVHDHPGIVLDEIAGYYLAMLFAPRGVAWLAAGFVLFRFFDIAKPWPIGWLDRRLEGGLGIVADDLVAGVFAGIVLLLAQRVLS